MEEELNNLHHLSTYIFANIAGITPDIKNLIAHAKAFYKSYQGTIAIGTQFIQSLDAFAKSALEAKGGTHALGETLDDIMNIFRNIENMKGDLMNVFMNEVICPLESRAEQEVNMSKLASKQYFQDNKVQTEFVGKLAQDLVKLRKKSQKKKGKAGKYEKREEELLEEFKNEENTLRGIREQGLRRALIGERRIYCFVADRLCSFGRGMAAHSNRVSSMLNDKIDVWNSVVSNPSELPVESEKVIQEPSVHYTATVRRKKQNMAMASRANTLDNSPRPSVIGKEVIEPIPENEGPQDDEESIGMVSDELDGYSEQSHDSIQSHEERRQSGTLANGGDEARFSMIVASSNHRDIAASVENTPDLRAIYSHVGSDSSQLSFSKGDLIFKLSAPTGGWQYGKHQKTEKSGWFPAAYVEASDSISVTNAIVSELKGIDKKSSSLRHAGPVRRYSTPATTSAPYIPAPDYDDLPAGIPIANGNFKKEELQLSSSSPGFINSNTQKPGVYVATNSSNTMPPPPSASEASVNSSKSNENRSPEADPVAMPFPPPPPVLGGEEQGDRQSNPFADVKLKKAVTNDRSMPKIS